MSTFAEDIEAAAALEPIEAIIIEPTDGFEDDPERFRPGNELRGHMVSWLEAKPALNYHYNTGYGLADCHAILAWTPTRVLFVHEYDGSTRIESVPRDPGMWTPRLI